MTLARNLFAKTKIVCTLGPASNSDSMLSELIQAGMDVARFNFSHGTLKDHTATLRRLRSISRRSGEPICVLQDLQGPKIRIGDLAMPSVEVKAGETITITSHTADGTGKVFPTTYRQFHKDVKTGSRVLIDDGKISLRVNSIRGDSVKLAVLVGGLILPHKGINLPGVKVSAPSLSEKDMEDCAFGFEHDVDYIALSFIRSPGDIVALRDFMSRERPNKPLIPIIAKIEKVEAIDRIDDIIREADAVMVARGDLGVELPAEDVPLLQKTIVRKCNAVGKPVIIATQMLESMINSPLPTRAEANDVANAVLDGADAVMLSGETSTGHYPVEAVRVMNRIINTMEGPGNRISTPNTDWIPTIHPYDPLSRAACMLAKNLNASAIVTLTHTGETAYHLAKYRPSAPIVAVTASEAARRRLNLVWGVRGMIVGNLKKDTDETFRIIEQRLLAEGFIRAGDTVVVLAGIPLWEGHPTNAIKVDVIPVKKKGT
jgi:pyruvate kinase